MRGRKSLSSEPQDGLCGLERAPFSTNMPYRLAWSPTRLPSTDSGCQLWPPSQPPLPNQFPENLSLVTFWNFHCNWPSAGDTTVGLDDWPRLLTVPFPNPPFSLASEPPPAPPPRLRVNLTPSRLGLGAGTGPWSPRPSGRYCWACTPRTGPWTARRSARWPPSSCRTTTAAWNWAPTWLCCAWPRPPAWAPRCGRSACRAPRTASLPARPAGLPAGGTSRKRVSEVGDPGRWVTGEMEPTDRSSGRDLGASAKSWGPG